MKTCIHKHLAHLDKEAPEAAKTKLFWFEVVWRPPGPLIRVCEVPLRIFTTVPMTISAAMANSAARDSFAERTDLCHQYSLSPVENFIGGVVDTGEQFNSLSPVSLTPVNNL
jgi:hypothetical protein